jgi:hypothetical protein
MGSVGPNHVVELLNASFSVYDKTNGQLIERISQDDFWNAALANTGSGTTQHSVDPRVVYDHASERWFASSLDRLSTPARQILVGVSNSSNPSDGWNGFLIDPDPTNLYFADFPTLGLNEDGVYIQANMFDYRPDGVTPDPPLATTLISIPKADLLSTNPTVDRATVFPNLDPNDGVSPLQTMQPTLDFGVSNGREPLLNQFGPQLYRVDILDAAGNPSYTDRQQIPIDWNGDPPDAEQPGGGALVETGANFLRSSAVKQDDSLWITYGEAVDGRAGIRWAEISESTNAILQTGTIGDPELHLFYPSIAVNEFGDVVIGFSGSSFDQYVSAYFVVGMTLDGITTFTDANLLKAGTATFLSDLTGPVRWGDYSATVLDPTNPRSFWTFQEFVTAEDEWAIQIARITTSIPSPSPLVLLVVVLPVLIVALHHRNKVLRSTANDSGKGK